MQKNSNMPIEQNLLEVLSLEVTTKCNLNCTHCFALAGISKKEPLEWNRALDIVKEGFHLGFRLLHLTGGETFLWKYIFKLLDFVFGLGYTKIIINTNAMLLTDKICKKLAMYDGKIILTCSINGDKSIHESVRGGGTYKKACAGIEKALEYGINVDIYTTVEKKLLPNLPIFVDTLFKQFIGLKNLFLIQLRNVERGAITFLDQMLSPNDFIKLVRLTGFLRLKGYPLYILENPLSNVVANCMNMDWLPKSPEINRYGKIMVLSSGKITANHSSRDSYGYYSPGKLEKILTSARYLEDVDKNTVICPLCEFYTICGFQGMIQPSSKDHNNTEGEVPFCKKVLQNCNDNDEFTKDVEFTE